MALKINNEIIKEDIIDQKGNVIGVIQFNKNDEGIMKSLSDIIRNLTDKTNKQKAIGNVDVARLQKTLETEEDFEKSLEDLSKINQVIDLEHEAVKETIESFEKVFGKETMDVITGGCVSFNNIRPLIEFLTPYIKEARESQTNKYLSNNSNVL